MTGWTWEYIGSEMTVPRLEALLAFWRECPPQAESLDQLRRMMRGYFGIKDDPVVQDGGELTDEQWEKQARELKALFGG